MENLKNSISDGVAEVLLYGTIGTEEINGARFASTISMLNDMIDVNEINVRINSSGGSVIEGLSIFSAIANSKKPCNTINDGIAASIAGIILQAGAKRYASDFSKTMIHEVSNGTQYQLLQPKQKVMVDSLKDTLLTILDNNSKMDRAMLNDCMTAETWFDSSEALKNGLIDEVIKTGRVYNASDDIELLVNEYSKSLIINQLQMENVKNHLGLETTANEETIIASIDTMKNSIETLTNSISENEATIVKKDEEIEALKLANNSFKEVNAISAVENAIEKGIFDVAKKDELIEQAKNDLDGFVKMVGMIKPQVVKVMNNIEKPSKAEGKTFRQLEKEDPKFLETLKNESPEEYATLFEAEYGTKLN